MLYLFFFLYDKNWQHALPLFYEMIDIDPVSFSGKDAFDTEDVKKIISIINNDHTRNDFLAVCRAVSEDEIDPVVSQSVFQEMLDSDSCPA